MRIFKKTGLILLLISCLILSQISVPAAYAENLPEVQYYKMISENEYLNMYTDENEIGIIIGFDSLQGMAIDPGTTYVLLNLTIDDPGAGLSGAFNVETFRINGVNYFLDGNELLFKFDYSNQHFPPYFDQGLNLIKVEKVVINATTEIPVNMDPLEGFRVYWDDCRPHITGAEIVENESNEVYRYNDTIKIEISFDEPVVITEGDLKDAFRINLWELEFSFENKEFPFSSYSVNGTVVDAVYGSDVIVAECEIADIAETDQGVINYSPQGVRLFVDSSKIRDVAGNELSFIHEYYEVVNDFNDVDGSGDYILIDTSHPDFMEYTYSDDEYIEILFGSSFFNKDEGAEAGIFLSPDKIDDAENIDYYPYPLSEDNFEHGIDPDFYIHRLTVLG